jgi:hypothetical protein
MFRLYHHLICISWCHWIDGRNEAECAFVQVPPEADGVTLAAQVGHYSKGKSARTFRQIAISSTQNVHFFNGFNFSMCGKNDYLKLPHV